MSVHFAVQMAHTCTFISCLPYGGWLGSEFGGSGQAGGLTPPGARLVWAEHHARQPRPLADSHTRDSTLHQERRRADTRVADFSEPVRITGLSQHERPRTFWGYRFG